MSTATQDLINAVHSVLSADLPALVTAAGLPPIKEFLKHQPAVLMATKAPQLMIGVATISRSKDPKLGATISKYVEVRRVLVAVSSAGSDQDAAALNLVGYADLIRRCLDANKTANGTSLMCLWEGTDFTVPEGSATSLYQEAILTFTMTRQALDGVD